MRMSALPARLLLAALFGTVLTACETIPITVTGVECMAFEVITFSAAGDTPETIAQVRRHNAAYRALCGG